MGIVQRILIEQINSFSFVKIPGFLQSAIPFRLFAENSNE
jgi:hypothetical protein